MANTLKVKANSKDLMSRLLAKLQPDDDNVRGYEIVRSSEAPPLSTVNYVLTTGIQSIDALSGGLPFGRIVEIYGVEMAGKTALALRSCVRAQNREIYSRESTGKTWLYKKVPDSEYDVVILYVDNEQSLDDGEKLKVDGVEIDALIGRCDTVDQLFDLIEKTVDNVVKMTEDSPRKCFVVIVVDTIAGTSTQQELDAEWDSQDYPRAPIQLRRAFRKLTRKINRHNILLICTNQVGDNFKAKARKVSPFAIDLPRPEDFTSPGGRALKFYASLRIFVFVVNQNYKLTRNVGGPSGFSGGFITVKNRQLRPLREGRYVLLYDGGFSDIFSLLETLIKFKTAERGKEGVIEFKFRANGIDLTTFQGIHGNRNPKLIGNSTWPAFYAEHKVDLDKLWQKTVDLAFNEANASQPDEDELAVEDEITTT